jgi:hypothetical protein
MQNEKKYFLSTDSMLDADSADFVVPQNAWVNMENARTGSTDDGVIGTVESIGSTELIAGSSCVAYRLSARGASDAEFSYIQCNNTPVASVIVPRNTFITITALSGSVILIDGQGDIRLESSIYLAIGMADDVENKRFVTLYYDTSGNNIHKIECSYTDTNTTYLVLESSDVVGGLNFTSEPIHSAKITNNILSWVDGTNNEPRKINIESGMVSYDSTFQTNANPYSFPLNFSEITLIKRPPIYTPNIQKVYESTYPNNFIANESFEFAFQYTYYDNETSVIGAYSQASKLNYSFENYNKITVRMDSNETVPGTVKIINLIARISDGTNQGGFNAVVIKTWDKDIVSEAAEIISQNNRSSLLAFDFYNNISGETIATDDVLRQFDKVPIYSYAHEVAKNRIFLGNNIEGYDAPKETSLSIAFNNLISPSNTQITGQLFYLSMEGGTRTFASTRYASYLVYASIPPSVGSASITGYWEIQSTIQRDYSQPWGLPLYWTDAPSSVQVGNLVYVGSTHQQAFQYIQSQPQNQYILPITTVNRDPYITDYIDVRGIQLARIPITGVIVADAYNIFPQLSSYKYGIVFYDYAMRKCSVVPYQKNEYQLQYTFSSVIESILPNTIKFTNNYSSYFRVGDRLVIDGSSSISGTYTVQSIVNSNSITVTPNLTTPTTISSSFSILRLSTSAPTTPIRDYSYTSGVGSVSWQLTNGLNAINEIPDWAYYYSIVRTLNLRTRYFIQGYSDGSNMKYVSRDSTGAFTYPNSNTFNGFSTIGVAIDTTSIINAGLGYQYTEGDVCILVKNDSSNTSYQLPVIGQDGNYIILSAKDIGSFGSALDKFIYEVYTPYQTSEQEPYYEMGEMYSVVNPNTSSRLYNVTSGNFIGDTYLLLRSFGVGNTYYANAMSPNDLLYKRWDTDASKINFITKLGRVENTTQISWSDTVVSGTQINGSSTFRIGNDTYVPDDCGAISKLILTSKVQEQGTVMLSICTNETNSMYLGETQITDSTGKVQFFGANASQVISTINTLKGSFGTVNPEAVTEFRGSVFYPDANRGVWVQYSSNGLFPISNYKMTRFWKLFFQRYLSPEGQQYMSSNNIRPYLFSTVDASHLELLISIPEIYDTPPKGYLVDYPNEVYPFDIYDGKGKSIVFCLENTGVQPHWQGSYSFNPEQFMSLQNKLYSVKNGNLFQHNMTDSFNNFYGTQYTSKIMVVSNQLPQRPKVYNNVSVEANMKPIFVYFYNDYPYLQTSDLEDVDFRDLEGVYYATLYRNKIIDNGSGTLQTTGLLTGEKMRNVAMKIMLEFDVTQAPLELKFLNIGYDISKGHTT